MTFRAQPDALATLDKVNVRGMEMGIMLSESRVLKENMSSTERMTAATLLRTIPSRNGGVSMGPGGVTDRLGEPSVVRPSMQSRSTHKYTSL